MANTGPSFAFPKGEATRREREAPRRAALLQRVCRRFRGHKMAWLATKSSALSGRPDVRFSFDAERALYVCHDDGAHCFAHHRRLWTLFDGRHARGTRLAMQYMLDQIAFSQGDWIVDVGANTGDLMLAFSALDCPVNYIGFEPSPDEFRALQQNLTLNNNLMHKEAHQIALWNDDTAELTFYLQSSKADSSLLPIRNPTAEIKVPSGRLDKILPDRRYKLLKLEAEGAEPEILQGAGGIIHRFDYVAADVGFERGLTSASTLPEVTNFLTTRNFEICAYNGLRHCLLFKNKAAELP